MSFDYYDSLESPEICAEKLCTLPIKEQLKQRHICKITSSSTKSWMTVTYGGFIVFIQPGRGKKRLFEFGHELGHTYFFEVSLDIPNKFPCRLILSEIYQNSLYYGGSPAEQEWCDSFAINWMGRLSSKDKQRLNRIIRKNVEIKQD